MRHSLFLVVALGLASRPAAAKERALGPALKAALLSHRAPAAAAAEGAIILDPGHGGHDWGATVGELHEKDIVLSVAKKLEERLGPIPVRLTRESDVFLPLDERIEKSLDLNGAAFVSLHVNQVRKKKLQGITVYSFGRTGFHWWRRGRRHKRRAPPLPAPPKNEVKASVALAADVARGLRAEGFKVNQMDHAEYYVLKNPAIPSILIEMGYLSNPQEAARLTDPEYQDRLASAIAKSLQEHLAKSSPDHPAKLARYEPK